ncbi:MAG: exonuclease [Armatimonadetes bacterium]|nr:exonuclease [Armatimonadota bacterium]NIM24045.1 exonuclease [Armatimonadota bacterium]NIM67899.1 exonuclease [Armatimonadota bacterium]NIM76421.1 exonuclease [Armatimonadota bacterium]NIN06129.1 exonuclease [Armatimonadota bacterium]
MLTNTFIHIPGVGPAAEARLWAHGVRTWRDFLREPAELPFSQAQQRHMRGYLLDSEKALEAGNHRFFAQLLPSREQWRAFPEFSHRLAYLDIETTGLGRDAEVTMVGLFDGRNYRAYIKGINFSEFPRDIRKFSLLVTYFGTCFDLPFLTQRFSRLKFGQLHIDLCYLLRRLGYCGGLKHIEEKLGIKRSAETTGLSGFDAVRLWREYKQGKKSSLDLLVRYNMEDVTNLECLMRFGYNHMQKKLQLHL